MDFSGVLWPIQRPRVTMPFKATETKWYSKEKPHRGVDIAPWPGSHGEPVWAPAYGQVVDVSEHEYAGKELTIEIEVPYEFWAYGLDGVTYRKYPGDTCWIRMTHHSEIFAGVGDRVRPGQVLAKIGNTGKYTTGPHVHMELHFDGYPGRVVDPLDFFVAAIPGLAQSLIKPWQ